MASATELLAILNERSRLRKVNNPLANVAEGFLGGYKQEQDNRLANTLKFVQAEAARDEIEKSRYELERQKKNAEYVDSEMEKINGVEQKDPWDTQSKVQGKHGFPDRQKVQKTFGSDGKFSVTTTEADIAPKNIESLIAEAVQNGEMSLEQGIAFKERISHAGAGSISPSLQYQMQKDAEKRSQDEQGRTIPGYQPTGQVRPDDVEVRKLRESAPEFETFKTAIKDYRDLISKYGTQEFSNRAVQGQLEALSKNLQLKIKNLAQLGVLSASDVPFIEKQIPSPGFFKTQAGMIGALDTVEKLMETAMMNKMKSGGYAPVAPPATTEPDDDGLGWSNAEEEELRRLEQKYGGQ